VSNLKPHLEDSKALKPKKTQSSQKGEGSQEGGGGGGKDFALENTQKEPRRDLKATGFHGSQTKSVKPSAPFFTHRAKGGQQGSPKGREGVHRPGGCHGLLDRTPGTFDQKGGEESRAYTGTGRESLKIK